MFHTSVSVARPLDSGGILPLPTRMMLNSSQSCLPARDLGSVQSSRVSSMPVARSVLPFPLSPWHMEQSIRYRVLALACDSAVGLTGFLTGAAGGGASVSGGVRAGAGAGAGVVPGGGAGVVGC